MSRPTTILTNSVNYQYHVRKYYELNFHRKLLACHNQKWLVLVSILHLFLFFLCIRFILSFFCFRRSFCFFLLSLLWSVSFFLFPLHLKFFFLSFVCALSFASVTSMSTEKAFACKTHSPFLPPTFISFFLFFFLSFFLFLLISSTYIHFFFSFLSNCGPCAEVLLPFVKQFLQF